MRSAHATPPYQRLEFSMKKEKSIHFGMYISAFPCASAVAGCWCCCLGCCCSCCFCSPWIPYSCLFPCWLLYRIQHSCCCWCFWCCWILLLLTSLLFLLFPPLLLPLRFLASLLFLAFMLLVAFMLLQGSWCCWHPFFFSCFHRCWRLFFCWRPYYVWHPCCF